jgi:very-short-patch-repair endonuclease
MFIHCLGSIVEYDGDQHRTDKGQWSVDIYRGEEFGALGYRTVRITAAHLRRPRSVVWRVHDAIRAGSYAGPLPVFGPEWCSLFEHRLR